MRTSDAQLPIGESRGSPMCDSTSEVWSFGPSGNDDGNQFPGVFLRKIVSNQEPQRLPTIVLRTMEETPMAVQRNPNDPYRDKFADDPFLSMPGDQLRRQAPLDNELQVDPELAEGPASGGKVAMFAIAIAVVLGAVFYGLNNTSINQAGTSSTAQNTAQSSPRAAPPGM